MMDAAKELRVLIKRLEPKVAGLPLKQLDVLSEVAAARQGRLHLLEAVEHARAALASKNRRAISRAARECRWLERTGQTLYEVYQRERYEAQLAAERARAEAARDALQLLAQTEAEHKTTERSREANRAGGLITGNRRAQKAKERWRVPRERFAAGLRPDMSLEEEEDLRRKTVEKAIREGLLPSATTKRTMDRWLPLPAKIVP